MSKKLSFVLVSLISVLAFSIFSFVNAIALAEDVPAPTTPITDAVRLCKAAKKTYKADVAGVKAKGLSLQLSKEEIDKMIKEIGDYRKQVCAQAAAITSAVKLCKQAKKTYLKDVKNAKAKGLSLQLTKEEIDNMVQAIKDYRKQVCKEAQEAKKKPKTSG